jgi:hypothetical protein
VRAAPSWPGQGRGPRPLSGRAVPRPRLAGELVAAVPSRTQRPGSTYCADSGEEVGYGRNLVPTTTTPSSSSCNVRMRAVGRCQPAAPSTRAPVAEVVVVRVYSHGGKIDRIPSHGEDPAVHDTRVPGPGSEVIRWLAAPGTGGVRCRGPGGKSPGPGPIGGDESGRARARGGTTRSSRPCEAGCERGGAG